MKRIPFESHTVEDGESVMFVENLAPSEIRFKHDTKEIFVVCAEVSVIKYSEDKLVAMPWREVKELVLAAGGEWTSKKKGIEFLLEVS